MSRAQDSAKDSLGQSLSLIISGLVVGLTPVPSGSASTLRETGEGDL